MVGVSDRNDRSNSSASTTMNSPWPSRALVPPSPLSLPPTMTVGSSPPSISTRLIIDVVVVLPCVPATPMPYFSRITSASISARRMIGIFRRWASRTSGLSPCTADE